MSSTEAAKPETQSAPTAQQVIDSMKMAAPRLQWHYGPTEADADPGKIWHEGCGGEVWHFDGGPICCKCNAQEEAREPVTLPPDWRTQVTSVASWTADEVVALVEEWQAGE